MLRITPLITVAALCFPPAAWSADPAHVLRSKKDAGVGVHKEADRLLILDAAAVLGGKGIDADSPAWAAAREEVSRWVAQEGPHRALQVRFYFSDQGASSAAVEGALRAHVKRLLADVEVYVVRVDQQVRNDRKTWAQYLKDKAP